MELQRILQLLQQPDESLSAYAEVPNRREIFEAETSFYVSKCGSDPGNVATGKESTAWTMKPAKWRDVPRSGGCVAYNAYIYIERSPHFVIAGGLQQRNISCAVARKLGLSITGKCYRIGSDDARHIYFVKRESEVAGEPNGQTESQKRQARRERSSDCAWSSRLV